MTGQEYAVLALLILVGMVARWLVFGKPGRPHRRSPQQEQPVVTVAVRGPVLKVPSLKDAYSALPPHCWDVLGR